MNYTEETCNYICKEYKLCPTRETVNRLAKELDKPEKSIIGKLSKEGVYRRDVYVTKLGEKPRTKAEIVEDIATHLFLDSDNLKGLDKTPKTVLKILDLALQNSIV